jgi:hypothetical protein
MKPVRIALESWCQLLSLVVDQVRQRGAPAPLIGYLQDRFLTKRPNVWSGFDNGWSEVEFDDWDKRAAGYAKAVEKEEQAKVALAAVDAAWKIEAEGYDASSALRLLLDNQFKPTEQDFSKFGLLCAKDQAIGKVVHAMTCFNKKLLASRIALDAAGVARLADAAISAADFHTRNRLASEYFPYLTVLQQIRKQPVSVLMKVRNDMGRLGRAVDLLPSDDADSRRQRLAQSKLMQMILASVAPSFAGGVLESEQ